MNGLKERWKHVERTLEDVLPVYEAANRVMSFGMVHRWRKLAVKLVARQGLRALDEGCGPGAMTVELMKECNPELVVCMDCSPKMVKAAKNLEGQLVIGTFEKAPFKTGAFDLVICGFSLRDAIDLYEAVKEQYRTLKPRGQVLVLDIMKPDSSILLKLYEFYWLIIAPLLVAPLTLNVGGPIKYLALHESYRRLPRISSLKAMYQKLFKNVFVFPIVDHMVAAFIARKNS